MTLLASNSKAVPPHSRSLPPTVFWRLGEDIPRSLSWGLMGISVAAPLLAWFALSNSGVIDTRFLPTPQMVIQALINLQAEGWLGQDTLASFLRVMSGFLLGALLAIPLGISMGAFASINALFEPIIGIIRYMPASAFVPLLVIYLGLGESPKIALIFIGTVFFNTLMVMDAVKFVPKTLLETTYTLGGNRFQTLMQVILPYVVPNILDTLRVNLAGAWNLVVVSELLAAETGLGKRIAIAQKFFNTDQIFACLIVLGLIGFLLDLSLRLLLRVTCRWSVD